MKKLLGVMLLCLINIHARAQEILPTELFQIYKYWQMDVAGFDKNTYDYIQTVDKQWRLRLDPQKTDHSLQLMFGYYQNKIWYKDQEYGLMLDYDTNDKKPKSVTYQFTDYDNWQRYNRQMALMDAVSLQTTHLNGGTQYTWEVNDIDIILSEFPPGVNGADRVYQVLLMHK